MVAFAAFGGRRRRRPRPPWSCLWALLSLLIAVSFGSDLAAADVMPPTGLVVKRSLSVDGAEATVEWCAPRCVDGQNKISTFEVSLYEAVSVPVGGWGGDTVYETVYEEVSTEETHTEVGVMCQTPGGSRQPVEHRIRGLTAYTEYLVRVRSRSYDEQNGPLSDVEESPELVVRAGVTPKGSGREQRDRSGLQTSLDRKKTMYHPDQTRHYQMGLFDRHPGQDTEFTGESWNQMDKRGSIAFDPDGDGNLDLFFVIAKTCFPGAGGETCIDYENVLFQNNGSGWFYTYGYFETSGPQPLPDTKRDSRAAVAGDFDGDGFVDLFVVNFDEENELLLNDGTGNFSLSEEAGDAVTTTERSVDVVAGDFDGDGFVDLFVVNYGAVNELFWNDGTGSFTLDDNPDSPLTNYESYSWRVVTGGFRSCTCLPCNQDV